MGRARANGGSCAQQYSVSRIRQTVKWLRGVGWGWGWMNDESVRGFGVPSFSTYSRLPVICDPTASSTESARTVRNRNNHIPKGVVRWWLLGGHIFLGKDGRFVRDVTNDGGKRKIFSCIISTMLCCAVGTKEIESTATLEADYEICICTLDAFSRVERECVSTCNFVQKGNR